MQDKAARFAQALPGKFFLNGEDLPALTMYLLRRGQIGPDDQVLSAEKPGEGNMNYVLRVTSHIGSIILKQARPWVEKYPMIDAPVERVKVEATYLKTVHADPFTARHAPRLLWFDRANLIMALEDLGESADYLHIYQPQEYISSADLRTLLSYLVHLHGLSVPSDFPSNMDMRRLNHEHIFRFPFDDGNGMNLDEIQPGLARAALPYQQDLELKSKILTLGDRYLGEGSALIHGDYYPGSWLSTRDGLKVIDPEFGFLGPPEFDLGVMLAHMMMGQQPKAHLTEICRWYLEKRHLDGALLSQFAGVEMLRRLIGIAQLPLSLTIEEKSALMTKAAAWIMQENLLQEL